MNITPCGLLRTDVSEELSVYFIRVARIGELRTTILVSLMKEALNSSETLVLTRATRRNIPEGAILHSHRRENLKSYIVTNMLVSKKSPPHILDHNSYIILQRRVARIYSP
jgi:hypothetical protein